MRLIRTVVCTTALFAIPAGSALAAPVGHRVDQDPDDVRAYWTDERMKNARPVERAKPTRPPGGGGGGEPTNTWTSGAVAWSTADALTRSNGKVFFTDSGVNYVCSGTVVSTNVVLTAGHCVHDGPGQFHTNWSFVPAYDNGGRPYGTFVATALFTTDDWAASGEFGRDVGAARTSTSFPTAVGSRGVATNQGTAAAQVGKRRDSFGYPAQGKFNGQVARFCDSFVSRVDTSSNPDTIAMPCDMNGGSSGGGWVDDQTGSPTAGQVVSLNSYGYNGVKNTMFGPVFDSETAEVLTDAGA